MIILIKEPYLGDSNETSFTARNLIKLLPLCVVLLHLNLNCINDSKFFHGHSELYCSNICLSLFFFTSTAPLDLLELNLKSFLLPLL